TPRVERRPKIDGNTSSREAAIGTCPIISVHPLSAPSDDTITATDTAVAAHVPQRRRAASAKGAVDFTRSSRGTTPSTTIVPNTYSEAAITIPSIVDRGIVRPGSRTSSAGTVADS